MPASAMEGLATHTSSSLPNAYLPANHRHNHKHLTATGVPDVNTTLAAVAATTTTSTTTTTIQNVHVVIVTSNKEQQMHHHHHHRECCDCCSDYSLSSCSSESDEGGRRGLGPPFEDPSQSFPALMPSGTIGDPNTVIPEEPREQAEGAEADEECNPPARAPFAQFSAAPSTNA